VLNSGVQNFSYLLKGNVFNLGVEWTGGRKNVRLLAENWS